eukprot:TRINITY_DN11051_c0_g1_i1.p1 TRINITY_DN11051_c0_g1~~TRINITY_DN11051_c0_g1_i1.p1  ORF type:complete len:315 (+),score=65.33 TRINITY_DN11051_c0_g1_i1:74-1018(+)
MDANNRYYNRASVICSHLIAPVPTSPFQTQTTSNNKPGLLEGQVAIVTGSGQGIGAETAKLFATEGAKVVVTDLDATKSHQIAQQIKASGGIASSFPGNVTDPKFPEALIKHTIENFGHINIIVNNAGYTWDGTVQKTTDEQWNAMLEVHLTAPFRIVRAAAPYMRDAAKEEIEKGIEVKPRCIINISSTSGLHGNFGQANYSAGKSGILGFTKTIAKEWGQYGVRCNAVAFGFIDTRLTQAKTKDNVINIDGKQINLGIPGISDANKDLAVADIPLKRPGTVSDAAGGILLLASPYSSYITGHTLEVTGGKGI